MTAEPYGPVTENLRRLREGDQQALDELVPLLYSQLRALAQSKLNLERANHTLSASGLVHEVYVRLLKQQQVRADDRLQFMGIAANTMRRVLVDWARAKRRQKRGGDAVHLHLDDLEHELGVEEASEIIALDEALVRFAEVSERGSQVVEHRFFAGLSVDETAALLGVSNKTVQRDWIAAKAWLRREVGHSEASQSGPG